MNAITNWKHWTWLDDGLLPLLVALLRACWLWPWLLLIQRIMVDSQEPTLLPWSLVVALPLLSLTLTRWLAGGGEVSGNDPKADNLRRTVPWRARIIVALSGLLTIALVLWWRYYAGQFAIWDAAWPVSLGDRLIHWGMLLPAPFLTLLVTAWLWQTGLLDAPRRMSHDDIWRAFTVGLGAIVFYLLASALSGAALTTIGVNLILLFFGLGMAALAFSSLKITTGLDRALGAPRTGMGSQTPPINRYWLLNTTLVVAGLLGLALLVIILIAPETLSAIFALLRTVVNGLLRVVGWILLGVAYVMAFFVYLLMKLLEPLIQRIMERLADSPLRELLQSMQEIQEEQPELATEAAAISDSYRWLALTALAIALAVAFALALRRLRALSQAEEEEERESIFSADLLQDQLGGLLSRWLNRLRNAGETLNPFLSLEGETDARRTIRAIYQQLLAGAEQLGHARHPSQTPVEYGEFLEKGIVAGDSEMRALTAGYLQARYALDLPTEDDASRVRRAWDLLRRRLTPQDDEEGV